jgi:hypothetical protein
MLRRYEIELIIKSYQVFVSNQPIYVKHVETGRICVKLTRSIY